MGSQRDQQRPPTASGADTVISFMLAAQALMAREVPSTAPALSNAWAAT
jgi:hypothetical protein